MAQKTNLNVSPYYDDFSDPIVGSRDKNYYKVLFNPGKPIQARELNTLQSILQDQVESFGSHIFKEGSMVIPGNIVYDNQFYAVKLNSTEFGVNIAAYIQKFVGKKITGQVSGTTATVQMVQLPNSEVDNVTLYVKYQDSDNNFNFSEFVDGELLSANENVEYNGTVINAGTAFASTISSDSTFTGSAASIGEGVYFIRGTFVRVPKQTIILDYYTNTPSYRVGLKINEQIITAKDDPSLYDNAKGFTNYAAPGADRFKISLVLTKKLIDDIENDTDFVELLRVKDGSIKKIETKSQYSIIRDYLAQRTYDESGDYVIDPFEFSINNSLNNRLGNDGLFFSDEKTDQGNTPSDDLMCIKFSPGKAYVRGYDIEKTGVEIVDVPKPRTTQTISNANIPFEMGNLIRVNNVSGGPKQKGTIELYNRRKSSTSSPSGTKIGDARVYAFNVTDSSYSGSGTNWDLYLYDIQTYVQIVLNQSISSTELPASSFVKGKSSGASGYVTSAGSGSDTIYLRQTSGTFIVGEQLLINGIDLYSRSIKSITAYSTQDIKSVFQSTAVSGFSVAFIADTQLDKSTPFGFSPTDVITIQSTGAVTSSGKLFRGISVDSIIRYQRVGFLTETYNRVQSVSSDGSSITLASVTSVPGICDGALPAAQTSTTFSIGTPKIRNEQEGYLYARFPDSNISSTNLNSSILTFRAQSNSTLTPSGNTLTVSTSNFNLGISSVLSQFQAFDEERYSIHYEDGTIEPLTSDKVTLLNNQVTFSNISNKNIAAINATFIKNGIQSKIKKINRSKVINVNLSKYPQSGTGSNSSINDGLTYNPYYGLRVHDEEICLNYPDVAKVIAIYESLDTSNPVLDTVTFSSIANVDVNAIIGENIIGNTSKTIARIVTKPTSNTLGIVYLNGNRFVTGETVLFEESGINTDLVSITSGSYKNITNKFTLDKGQKDQYYDYSRIIRNSGEEAPSRKILVVFDYYTVPSSDTGDVFTVNSYEAARFSEDIPSIGKNNVRASDTLDFRPRVSVFTGSSSSPFDFSSRIFGEEPKLILSPNESSLVGYDFYLGRIDKVYLDKLGNFIVLQGVPAVNPKAPSKPDDVMEISTITLPPYLYNPKDASVSLSDNRRYTMRDIGLIEDRVENLERITSLSLLELNTQTLQIQDAQGFNRFKTGFFVDDFKNSDLINNQVSTVEVDSENKELTPRVSRNSINLLPVYAESFIDEDLDLTNNFDLYDSNVQKTNDVITLKYDSIGWIEQPLATKVENVNPFHVVSYSGNVKLNPASDRWVRTIRSQDVNINQTNWVWLRATGRFEVVGRSTSTTVEDRLLSSGTELYMRSRNTGFSAVNLKPLTRIYQFLDGNSGVDFIPKLIEISPDSTLTNYGASSAFAVNETVIGSYGGKNLISFRVAVPNHKEGLFNAPTVTYNINPYLKNEGIPSSYSASSKVLNVDINSLCAEAQGLYSGYVVTGMKLVGQTSGAIAYVKDLRLISDNYGDLQGSFFLRDPLSNPTPPVRIATGSKVYKLSSSSTNETPLPGSKLISSAETIYKAEGTWEQRQRITTTNTTVYFVDPLAQSFSVGGNIEDLNGNSPNDDSNGAYLTAVDIFFASKDPENAPVTVEVRTVELGTPTRVIVGNPVTLKPSDINISNDATVPTKVTFDYPIYLAPGLEYAIVLLAPQSDKYEVWIAEMGEKTVNTATLPDAESVRYTKQFAIGSLFKSQNGSIWTANQYQDMKFKLYKAEFTSKTGSVFFQNPTLNQSNGYVPTLTENPVTTLPKRFAIGVSTITDNNLIGILTTGRKIADSVKTYNYGYITGTGSAASSVGITTGGSNYTTSSNVGTYSITGNGSGLVLNINATNGTITSTSIVSAGNGYSVGDVVGIKTSDVSPAAGKDARITITAINGVDTLYISNVQGESFTTVGVSTLVYYNNSGTAVSLAGTTITSSTPVGGIYSGNFMKVNQFNHGMYAANNKLILNNIESNIPPTKLTSPLLASGTSISVASTSEFGTFEGIAVSGSNPGYIKIENEIIKYESVGTGQLLTISRGIDSTLVLDHDINTEVYKYELSGVSLRRINTTHDISDIGNDIDSYYVEFDRSNFDSNVTNRSSDASLSSAPQISFNVEYTGGGDNVIATQNIQYDTIIPEISSIVPGSVTEITAQIRSVSGTSVDGTEISFQDQGYENVEIAKENKLTSTRIVCSNINEETYLDGLLRNKSLTTKINLSTSDTNLSPMIFWKNSSVRLLSSRLNSPVSNYILDNRVNSLLDDPHASVYVSNTVRLTQPATALKVIVGAYRHSSADFRVLYSLIRPDSSEVEQSFELFPGYNNLTSDFNQDGYPDVIDPSNNSGLPDVFVPASLDNQFLEYEFNANNLGDFTGYTIKIVMSGTNQAYAPRFKDLRSIAIR
jgi:virulence-associated protein VapD